MFTSELLSDAGTITGLPITEATRRLRLGQPAEWTFAVTLGGRDHDLARLAALFDAGPVRVAAKGPDGSALNPALPVARAAAERTAPGALRLTVTAAAPPPDPTPRRRVLHPATVLDAAKAYAHVAAVPTAVANVLSGVALPDGPHCCFLQDGEDDFSCLRRVLAQHDFLQTERSLRGLTLAGVVAPAKQPGWRLTWGRTAAFRHLNQLGGRTVAADGDPPPDFAFGAGAAGPTVWLALRRRRFAGAEWSAWSRRELPLFLGADGPLVGATEDRLYVTQAGEVGWETRIETWPGTATLPPVVAARPWLGVGVVTGWDDGWLRARQPGFEATDDGDVIHARLLTPSSGAGGEKGLHLIPAEGTTVLLGWSGWLGSPAVALGNIRDRPPRLEAPSLWLDELVRLHFGEVEAAIEGSGNVETGGDLTVKSGGEIRHVSKGRQTFKDAAGGAALDGGIWKAGWRG
jgi:hypothetical protein